MKNKHHSRMVMIGGGKTIRIANHDCIDFNIGDYHLSHNAELVPQTEAGYQDYHARHGGRLLYRCFSDYPDTV